MIEPRGAGFDGEFTVLYADLCGDMPIEFERGHRMHLRSAHIKKRGRDAVE
jgi:hypothetical protein